MRLKGYVLFAIWAQISLRGGVRLFARGSQEAKRSPIGLDYKVEADFFPSIVNDVPAEKQDEEVVDGENYE